MKNVKAQLAVMLFSIISLLSTASPQSVRIGDSNPAPCAGEGTMTATNAALLRWYSQTYSVGTAPLGVAFDGCNIWMANNEGNTVTKLLASSGAVVGTYTVGNNRNELAFDGSHIWVTNYGSNTVTKLLAKTGTVVGTYSVGNNTTNPTCTVFCNSVTLPHEWGSRRWLIGTTTTITASQGPSMEGQIVTFCASVDSKNRHNQPDGGTVGLSDSPADGIVTPQEGGCFAVSELPVGIFDFQASYSGYSQTYPLPSFKGSSSKLLKQLITTVNPYGFLSWFKGFDRTPPSIALTNLGQSEFIVTDISTTEGLTITENECQNGVKPLTHCNVYYSGNGTMTFTDTASNSPQSITF